MTESSLRFKKGISIHAPHAGCDRIILPSPLAGRLFQSTHPMRGATTGWEAVACYYGISIHTPHAGCDRDMPPMRISILNFNPRTPCGVRPGARAQHGLRVYFNPRTPCGVRLFCFHTVNLGDVISIHAPHAGCDRGRNALVKMDKISIHAPHAGCDRTA